jgi:hypothetical protein
MTAVADHRLSQRFQGGQDVIYTPGDGGITETEVTGRNTRLLPREGDDYQYHFRREPVGPERRALENQIRPSNRAGAS